jgi:MFS family permease
MLILTRAIGSNFFAPIFSGFVADELGWQWVLYLCAIFNGAGGLFLVFFLEETNYSRHIFPEKSLEPASGSLTPQQVSSSNEKTTEPNAGNPTDSIEQRTEHTGVSSKTFYQKMQLFGPGTFSKRNQILRMMERPLIFLSFPVIAYAGFCYGSNLVWFNVLNATASLILTEQYNFSASMVGVAYGKLE